VHMQQPTDIRLDAPSLGRLDALWISALIASLSLVRFRQPDRSCACAHNPTCNGPWLRAHGGQYSFEKPVLYQLALSCIIV
jgi:hypothetical protein